MQKFKSGDSVILKEEEKYNEMLPQELRGEDVIFTVDRVKTDLDSNDIEVQYLYLKGLTNGKEGGWYSSRFELAYENVNQTKEKQEETENMNNSIEQLNKLQSLVEEAILSPTSATQQYVDSLISVRDNAYNIKSEITVGLQKFLNSYDEAIDGAEDALIRLQDHIDILEEQVLDNQDSTIILTVQQFSQVIRSGELTLLEGEYTDPTGQVSSLRINDSGKIRPPVNIMLDKSGSLKITDIVLVLKTGTLLDFDDIKAILPEGC